MIGRHENTLRLFKDNEGITVKPSVNPQPRSDGLPFFQAEWPAPANVKTLVSTRNGGVSQAPYSSLNVGGHVGDRPENVTRNREIVQAAVPVRPPT